MLSGNQNTLPFPRDVFAIIAQHVLNYNGVDDTLALFLLNKKSYSLFKDPNFLKRLTLYFRDVEYYYEVPFSEVNRALMSAYLEKNRHNNAEIQEKLALYEIKNKSLSRELNWRYYTAQAGTFIFLAAVINYLINSSPTTLNLASLYLTLLCYLSLLRLPGINIRLPYSNDVAQFMQLSREVSRINARQETLQHYALAPVYPDIANFFHDKNKHFLFAMNQRCKLTKMPKELLKLISDPETGKMILSDPVTDRKGITRSQMMINGDEYFEGYDYFKNINLSKIIKALIDCYRDDASLTIQQDALSCLRNLLICPITQNLLVKPVLLIDGTHRSGHVCAELHLMPEDMIPDAVTGKIAQLFPDICLEISATPEIPPGLRA